MTAPLEPLTPLERVRLEAAVSSYQQQLDMDPEALGYLASRGLTTETVGLFRLGYVDEPGAGHGRYRGMLAIPTLTGPDAHPVSLRFRCIQGHEHSGHGKYNSMRGAPNRLYNATVLHAIGPDEDLHLTEGEIDTQVLTQLGYRAVGVTGAAAFTAHHASMLAGAPRVYVWGDGDAAGQDFIAKATGLLRGSAVGVPMPDGMDVNDLFLDGGAKAISSAIERVVG